jgi:capsular polysaccharide biosynthesis protein
MVRPTPKPLVAHGRHTAARFVSAAIERGLPPRLTGYRALPRVRALDLENAEIIHQSAVVSNPLPRNVASREDLPSDAGWWGYSMRDVPERHSDPTAIVPVGHATIVGYRNEQNNGDYVPAVVTSAGRTLEARELRFRPGHARVMRASNGVPQHLARATWIVERVYHNHSHWLTAHLPKLLLLRERDELHDVILPDDLGPAILDSIRRVGIDPDDLRRVDLDRPIVVDELRLLVTDRFRPELVRLARHALTSSSRPPSEMGRSGRTIFISRRLARSRRLLNEAELLERLAPLGVEAVVMEDLTFDEQIDLMNETSLIVGPHGAGLTNMIACHAGTRIVEVADLSFPNPNFYALASALDHRYSIVGAASIGDGPPLHRDLVVDASAVFAAIDAELTRTEAS